MANRHAACGVSLRESGNRDKCDSCGELGRRQKASISGVIVHFSADGPTADAEEALLTGALEPTNEWYAIAKIAGIKLCQAFRRQYGCDFVSVMPTNLYGPGDRYDAENGHVVAALIMKIHAASMANQPTVELWGSGTPRREFLFTEDWPTHACL